MVLDSGFWVLAAICGLHSIMGIFVGALIKKHKYWPELVPSNAIDKKFENLKVCDATSVKGSYDRVLYNTWCTKDVGYMTEVMGTGLGLGYLDDRMHST